MTARAEQIHRLGLALILALGAVSPARAFAAPDEREIVAREDFAAGRYDQALEIFARLYAETLHPNYLRNIGRCYQNLGEPDRAITSFREYLHKAKTMSADERAEIEGYIKEMEELKRTRAESGAAPKSAGPPGLPAPSPVAQPASPPATKIDLTLKSAPPAPAREEEPAIYERWWFWAIVAGVAGAGVGVAAAAGAFTHTNNASCLSGFTCGP